MGEGDVDFEAWYEAEHRGLVRALWALTGDEALAQDLAAEACSRALARWGRVGAMASPGGWTYRTAINLVRRHERRRRLEAQLLRRHRIDHVVPPAATDVDLWAAVAALPDRQREAVALRYLGGLREQDIAAAMGISEGGASAALSAARRSLATALETSHDRSAP